MKKDVLTKPTVPAEAKAKPNAMARNRQAQLNRRRLIEPNEADSSVSYTRCRDMQGLVI